MFHLVLCSSSAKNHILVQPKIVSLLSYFMHLTVKYNFIDFYYNIWVMQEASAIPFAALTAWRALKSTARISEGYACNPEIQFCFLG